MNQCASIPGAKLFHRPFLSYARWEVAEREAEREAEPSQISPSAQLPSFESGSNRQVKVGNCLKRWKVERRSSYTVYCSPASES